MTDRMHPGIFLTIDGIDGAGKSTQLKLLAEWLRSKGCHVVTCRDPGSTAVGDAVRKILLSGDVAPIDRMSEMLLYMAARAQLVEEVIRPALAEGSVVLSDRYLLANVVYQGWAGGLEPGHIWQIGEIATRGLMPDLALILDMDPEAAISRINRPLDRMEKAGLEFRRALRQGFLAEAKSPRGNMIVIDASQSVESVQESIRDLVARELATSITGEQ